MDPGEILVERLNGHIHQLLVADSLAFRSFASFDLFLAAAFGGFDPVFAVLGLGVARKLALLFSPASLRSLLGAGFTLLGREFLGAGVTALSSKFNRVGLFLFCQSAPPYSSSLARKLRACKQFVLDYACKHAYNLNCSQLTSSKGRQQMAKKNYKLRLPKGKILQFTPTGKSVPMSEQTIADDQLLARSRFRFADPDLRGAILAQINGGDDGLRKYLDAIGEKA
jgi:hypothetical protein